MSDIFCQIVAGDQPAEIVWRDDHTVAFLDTHPVFKGHVLVVPTRHIENLAAADLAVGTALWQVTKLIAQAQQLALGCTGNFIAINNIVSQSVPHLHQHVIPRTKGDGLRGFFWPRVKYAPGEAHEYGERLRSALS